MLKTPPFLIAAVLALWAWRTGWWVPAVVMAVLFESSRFLKLRWDFTDKEYSRIFDVCTLLFAGAMIYLRFNEDIARSGFLLFQWMPVVFALSLLTQAYGTLDKIPYRVFSWFARLRKDKPEAMESGLNVSWPYFGICLLAAGATNTEERDLTFYFAVVVLCAWVAWATRVRRYATPLWAACCLCAALLGFAGQSGWVGFQRLMTPLLGRVFARFSAGEFDAQHTRTTMGEIGSKKNSGKIVLRVKAERGRVPHLLRQASYDILKDTSWNGAGGDFDEASPENDVTTWTFIPGHTNLDSIRISGYLPGRKGLLSLPQGAKRLRDLPVGKLATSRLGVVRAEQGPGVVSYLAEFSPGPSIDSNPDLTNDLKIPPIEKPVIAEIAAQIKSTARGTNQLDLVTAVERYFSQHFTYSLYRPRSRPPTGTPIAEFLKDTHTGHCEYFASATTLLLRELEIPARYTVGFSAQEAKGETYLIRQRHAHAWVIAWLDGAWREIDTTPGTWFNAEREQASPFEWINDFFSDLWFKFSAWRWLGQKGFISRLAPYLILPLVAILIWRIFFRKKRADQKSGAAQKFNWPGLDSEYYQLEARLAAAGHERHPHETPAQFLIRLQRDGITHPSLPALLDLHYRYRFDPRGLPQTDRNTLRQLAGTRMDSPKP